MINDELSRINLYHVDLSEYDSLHAGWENILVPRHLPLQWKKHIAGALATCAMGNSSVDYTLKRYFDGWEDEKHDTSSTLHRLTRKLLDHSRKESLRLDTRLNKIDFDQQSTSSLGVEASFRRLQSTYSAVRSLISMGYYFESMALLRQMIEQLSFCFALAERGNTSTIVEEPQKSIGKTARFIPEFGKFYGILSEQAHIMTHSIPRYLKIVDGQTQIIMKSAQDSSFAALILSRLLDFHEIILEYTYRERIKRFRTITKDAKGFHVNPARGSLRKYNSLWNQWIEESDRHPASASSPSQDPAK